MSRSSRKEFRTSVILTETHPRCGFWMICKMHHLCHDAICRAGSRPNLGEGVGNND